MRGRKELPEHVDLIGHIAPLGSRQFRLRQIEGQLNMLGDFRQCPLNVAAFQAAQCTDLPQIGRAATGEFHEQVVAQHLPRRFIAGVALRLRANAKLPEPPPTTGATSQTSRKHAANVREFCWQ